MKQEKITEIATKLVLAAFGLITLGTVATPAILMYVVSWKFVFLYPAALLAVLLMAATAKK